MRDMLIEASTEPSVSNVSGRMIDIPGPWPRPEGSTSIARELVLAVQKMPDSIFIISDGYENAPAGQTADVIEEMRKMGIVVPIYHFNPVVAAEAGGVRELAPGLVPTLPVSKPDGVGVSILRGIIDQDPVQGVNALLGVASVRKLMPCQQ